MSKSSEVSLYMEKLIEAVHSFCYFYDIGHEVYKNNVKKLNHGERLQWRWELKMGSNNKLLLYYLLQCRRKFKLEKNY